MTEGAQLSISIPYNLSVTNYKHIDYSLDNGKTWVITNNVNNQGFNIIVPALHLGHSVLFKGEGITMSSAAYDGYNCQFTIRSGEFNCSGNVLSLLFGEDAVEQDLTANYTFFRLFQYCVGLKTAPKLPSKNLSSYCYKGMFQYCSGLTESPILPALDLSNKNQQYEDMFDGCTSLNKITMLATAINYNSLQQWVRNVGQTGVFIKNPAMTTLPTGNSGIPTGWTVEDYVE